MAQTSIMNHRLALSARVETTTTSASSTAPFLGATLRFTGAFLTLTFSFASSFSTTPSVVASADAIAAFLPRVTLTIEDDSLVAAVRAARFVRLARAEARAGADDCAGSSTSSRTTTEEVLVTRLARVAGAFFAAGAGLTMSLAPDWLSFRLSLSLAGQTHLELPPPPRELVPE